LTDPKNDAVDESHRRYYKLETFSNAVEKRIRERDRFVHRGLVKLLSGQIPASVSFQFDRESQSDITFRISTVSRSQKRATAFLVAAKSAEEHSAQLGHRVNALEFAYTRAPRSCAKLIVSGSVYLPDRHHRKDQGREIAAYIVSMPPGAHPLRVGRGGRLCAAEPELRLLSVKEDRAIRNRLLELAAKLYDSKQQTTLRLPTLGKNEIYVRRDSGKLVVVAPEGLRTRLTVPRLIHELVTWELEGPGGPSRVRPNELGDFVGALNNAVGKEVAADWLRRYRKSVMAGKLPSIPPLEPEALADAGIA
jgi:hypothetical protein